MKKRLLRVLLMCCMVLTMLPTTANAATQYYNLWVGDTEVSSNNLSGDGWRYEPETNTLVLNGFGTATLGYPKGKDTSGYYADGKTYQYANIYSNGGDINIRTEGKESYIGDPDFGNRDRQYEDSDMPIAFTGIYTHGGNVTVTGSAKLNIGSNRRGICTGGTGSITFDNARDVEIVTYSGDALFSGSITLKGNSRVSAYAGHTGKGGPASSNINAWASINIYDNAYLYSDYELAGSDSIGHTKGIDCLTGPINVYGGEIKSIVRPNFAVLSSYYNIYALFASEINIEGGGVVDGRIYNPYDSKYYTGSVVYGFRSNATLVRVNFYGGVFRAGIDTKRPDGSTRSESLYPGATFADHVLYKTITDGGTWDRYVEISAYSRDGIYLWASSDDPDLYGRCWSYDAQKRYTESYHGNSYNPLYIYDKIIEGRDMPLVAENNTHIIDPYVNKGCEIPEMTVKSRATLTLKFDKDRDYTFTKPIYLEGGTLVIDGDFGTGIITGLDVRGTGTVIFGRGTVSGNVEKTVKTVMYNQYGAGGNIDIPDHGNAVDQDGNTVHKFAYKAETDYDYFDRVCIIRKVEERDFLSIDGKFHKAENGDKMLYLWTDRADRPHRIDAYPTDSTKKGQPLSLKYGTNTFAPGTPFTLKKNGVFVAKAGDNVVLSPPCRRQSHRPAKVLYLLGQVVCQQGRRRELRACAGDARADCGQQLFAGYHSL